VRGGRQRARVALLCWYLPPAIVQLMAVELLNLPHHAEAPLLPAEAARLPYWEQDTVTHSCAPLPVWSRLVIFNFNLHIAHHAFPAARWYRLPRIQRAIVSCAAAPGEYRMDEWRWALANRQAAPARPDGALLRCRAAAYRPVHPPTSTNLVDVEKESGGARSQNRTAAASGLRGIRNV